jgi:ABC-type polysaccharide/polyol phosphate export permease
MISTSMRRNARLFALLVRRDLKIKYRGSFLGYLWSMLNPLLFMVVLSLVFSKLVRGVEHYELYVLSGILFWNMTSFTLISGTHSFVSNAPLLRKIRLPYWLFALVPLGTAGMNLLLALVPYTALLIWQGVDVPPTIVLAPVVVALYGVFLAGVSLFLATANAFFRDVAHVIEPVLQLTFYATPVIYSLDNAAIPEAVRHLLSLNPTSIFLGLFRSTVYAPNPPEAWQLLYAALAVVVSCLAGCVAYKLNRNALAFRI